MSRVPARFRFPTQPVADPRAVVTAGNARFTMLTSRCIRMEWSESAAFDDRPSQVFWFRTQPVPSYTLRRTKGALTITTDHLRLTWRPDPRGFTAESLSVRLLSTKTTWSPGTPDEANLGGTARTLDGVRGHCDVGQGLLSRSGLTVVDDTASIVFDTQCWPECRTYEPGTHTDLYVFGYGTDYQDCVRDFCALSGRIPLIPRWALGNWWSRYWAYTDQELMGLMARFRSHEIPLSVCVVDMDWHVIENPTSRGWTGYTWNRDYFPNPKCFLKSLRQEYGLKVSLNLHPADGVHPHEEAYPKVARCMGIEPSTKAPVPFDITDPRFVEPYFRHLHHPHERLGVDFWWMDWQQGNRSGLDGLDPLYLLNHLHHLDLARDGVRRPFVFTRYAGLGSHRYQIGFSGDTIVSWESLAFQPYFTATASNVGYTWWSHDIGGHFWGVEDPELYARWVQLGTFSPIFRIHCSKNRFQNRHPWEHGKTVYHVAREAMRLRHALVPYLYTMNRLTHEKAVPLVRSMYWTEPEREEAYHCPGQYWFGTELIVAPFVTPLDSTTRLSRQLVWLPPGDWYHFSTGAHYRGGYHAVYGRLEDIPVFARAGAIVPLAADPSANGVPNPDHVRIVVFAGADNRFELYEDDGESVAFERGVHCSTSIAVKDGARRLSVSIGPAAGETGFLPRKRRWTVEIGNVNQPATIALTAGNRRIAAASEYDHDAGRLTVTTPELSPSVKVRLVVTTRTQDVVRNDSRRVERMHTVLHSFRQHTEVKSRIFDRFVVGAEDLRALQGHISTLTPAQKRCLCELLFEAGLELVQPAGFDSRRIVAWNNQRREDIVLHGHRGYNRHRFSLSPLLRSTVVGFGCRRTWESGAGLMAGKPWHVVLDYAGVHGEVLEGET